jgi:hypothetical protein
MKKNFQKQEGFTLLIAIITTGTLLLVAAGIMSLAVRSSVIYSAARESQYAFYAADTGVECALYWDVQNPSGFTAFSTSTSSQITCNSQTMNAGGSQSSEFEFNFAPDPYCAKVVVTKPSDGSTTIESFGYNSCDSSNTKRVERAVKVTY